MAVQKRADAVWNGDLMSGNGTVKGASGAVDVAVTWPKRAEEGEGSTSPEELIAAAHASCFAMALSFGLGNAGTPPERLAVSAVVTFDQVDGGWKVVSSALTVRGTVPGMDDAAFKQAAEGAKDNCPVSQALKGNVALSVDASLGA